MSPIGVSAGARPRHDSCQTRQVEMSLLRRRANRALFEVFNHRSAPLRHARGAQPIRVVPRDIVINAKTCEQSVSDRGAY